MASSSSSSSSTSLAPGFRFHPTDEELVRYYLRRKVCGKPFRFDAISDVEVYKVEPWDLPGKSRLKTKDLEWYFFSMLDKKYGNSSRTNRATERGYWKTTGKDRAVYHKSQAVGMKKTLVYHCGRAPRGERTNWVMHEYKLTDEGLEKAGIVQDAIVLCRVFQKSGAGPKNGAQYGAPLIEEEWEDDELEMVPKLKDVVEVEAGGDTYLNEYDLEQILGTDMRPVEAPIQLELEFSPGTDGTFVEDSTDLTNDAQNILVGNNENHCVPQLPDSQKLYEMPNHYETKIEQVGHEYLSESTKTFGELDYLLDESFWDAAEDLQFGDREFLETNDMLNPIAADTCDFDNMIAEYLSFHDANDDNLKYMASDPPRMVESVELPSHVAFLSDKDANEGTQQAISSSEKITEFNTNAASFSKQEPVKSASDNNYPFIKKASKMLGSIPAPPAFAAEFPTKKAARLLNSLSQSSRSMCVTAGVMQVRNLPRGGNGTDCLVGKHGGYNIILSIGLSRDGVNSSNLESTVSIHPGKSFGALSRVWFYFIFLWVVVLSVSFKFGSLICSR